MGFAAFARERSFENETNGRFHLKTQLYQNNNNLGAEPCARASNVAYYKGWSTPGIC